MVLMARIKHIASISSKNSQPSLINKQRELISAGNTSHEHEQQWPESPTVALAFHVSRLHTRDTLTRKTSNVDDREEQNASLGGWKGGGGNQEEGGGGLGRFSLEIQQPHTGLARSLVTM